MSGDVVVVGGGLVGLAAAWRIAARGGRVTVVERDAPVRFTSRAAAAMIAPVGYREPADDAFLHLRLDAQREWAPFAAELVEQTGIDPAYRRIGSLVAATDQDGLARVAALREFHAELGIESSLLDAAGASGLEPELRGALGGLHVPGEGCVDPEAAGRALVAGIHARGGTVWSGAPVAELCGDADRISGVRLVDGSVLAADVVLVAAGAASCALPGVPEAARFPLRAVKGQSVLVRDRPGNPLVRTVLRAGINVVPRGDGRLMIAGTVEDDAAPGDRNTVLGAYQVVQRAIEAVPALAGCDVDAWCVGQRPVAPDDAPVLGPSGVPGLWWSTGHSYYGILLSALTGRLVADALAGDAAATDRIGRFTVDRFAAGSPRYTSLDHDRHA
jgi:glycine oxidase